MEPAPRPPWRTWAAASGWPSRPGVSHEQGQGLGGHRPTPVDIHGQLLADDALLAAGLSDQRLAQAGALPLGDEPAHGEATE